MINKIIKINKKTKKIKYFYNFLIKIGKQKNQFLKKKYLLNNCIINTWIKIKIIKKIFFFGYSNSLLISGIIKFFFKILNNNKKNNILLFLKYDFYKILKLKISNFKIDTFLNIIFFIKKIINNN